MSFSVPAAGAEAGGSADDGVTHAALGHTPPARICRLLDRLLGHLASRRPQVVMQIREFWTGPDFDAEAAIDLKALELIKPPAGALPRDPSEWLSGGAWVGERSVLAFSPGKAGGLAAALKPCRAGQATTLGPRASRAASNPNPNPKTLEPRTLTRTLEPLQARRMRRSRIAVPARRQGFRVKPDDLEPLEP